MRPNQGQKITDREQRSNREDAVIMENDQIIMNENQWKWRRRYKLLATWWLTRCWKSILSRMRGNIRKNVWKKKRRKNIHQCVDHCDCLCPSIYSGEFSYLQKPERRRWKKMLIAAVITMSPVAVNTLQSIESHWNSRDQPANLAIYRLNERTRNDASWARSSPEICEDVKYHDNENIRWDEWPSTM